MAGILLNRNRQVPAEETPAFGGIAERFRRAGDLDRAIALCRDGLKRFPEQLSARVTLGWALLDKGQYDAARAELEQVLRKAPDNLAAIRGLAELHDRSEGAMSTDSEQESWRAEQAAETVLEQASAAEADDAAPQLEPAHLAPIQVDFGAADDGASPEVLHTGAQVDLDAGDTASGEAEPSVLADLVVTPVELEDAAAASMAAATEPAPFFVVDPGEAAADAPAQAADLVVETFDAGGDLLDAPLDDPLSVQFDVAIESAASATIDAASTSQSGAWDEAGALADAIAGDGGDVVLEEAAEAADAAWASPVDVVGSLETLDDVDEEAGQDLADAIRALEAASKRVEAKLAVPPPSLEPAGGAEGIAGFEFIEASEAVADDTSAIDALIQPVVETGHDGSFELVAPDLAAVELETHDDEMRAASDVDEVALDAHPGALSFDAPVEGAALEAAAEADLADAMLSLDAGAAAVDSVVDGLDAFNGIDSLHGIDASRGDDLSGVLDEAVSLISDAAGDDDSDHVELVAAPEMVAPADESTEQLADDAAALVDLIEPGDADSADDLQDPPAGAAAGGEWAPQDATLNWAPGFGAPDEAAAPELDDLVAAVGTASDDADASVDADDIDRIAAFVEAEPVDAVAVTATTAAALTRSQRTLLALERFLRQVQARQVALRSETVA